MSLRKTARAVVVRDKAVLLIERWHDSNHYFALPGGGIEAGEMPEVAVVRELMEEAHVLVRPRFVIARDQDSKAQHTYFLCDFLSGEAELPPVSTNKTDRYKPMWLPKDQFFALSPAEFNNKLRPLVENVLNGKLPRPV